MKNSLRLLSGLLFLVLGSSVCLSDEAIPDNWKPYVLSCPEPTIPMVALRKGWGGHITCLLTINPKNGVVDEVKVVRHTGYPKLDAIMVMTLFKWQFRPNTIKHARINYELGVYGRSRDYHSGSY